MKKFTININSKLKNVEITVKNGRKFTDSIIRGEYEIFEIKVSDYDLKRIKKYAVRNANDKSSNGSNWYAHCNGYSMDLSVWYNNQVQINTYFGFRSERR